MARAPTTPPETRARGAHFLHSRSRAVARIVEAARLRPGEHVLDVGAGTGSITRHLAAVVKPDGSVMAVESSAELCGILRHLELAGTTVVQGDALRVGLPPQIDAVVANPPFRIIPALLRRLLDHGFGRAVLVVPMELALRLTAAPGGDSYGRLSVEMGLRAKTRMVLELAERDFDPPPRVACAVVHVVPKPPDAALDGPTLEAVLEAAWSARRRTLRHALAPVAAPLGVAPQAVTDALSAVSAAGRTAGEVAAWEYAVIAKTLAAARPANR